MALGSEFDRSSLGRGWRWNHAVLLASKLERRAASPGSAACAARCDIATPQQARAKVEAGLTPMQVIQFLEDIAHVRSIHATYLGGKKFDRRHTSSEFLHHTGNGTVSK
jgi:hypothetical protein